MQPLEVLSEFGRQYESKHFQENIFDTNAGYLQTDVEGNDDEMPLQFFIDYNNIWWFSLLSRIEVYHTSYSESSSSGCICFDIYYGTREDESRVLRATQYVRFSTHGMIEYIRTFGSPQFWSSNPHPAVKLDALGNHVWLGSGYSMDYSTRASQLLLADGPVISTLEKSPDLAKQISLIRERLAYYVEHRSTQW